MTLRLGEETKTAIDSKGVEYTLHRLYDGDRRGGWVEKLENIKGTSWVADEAEVYGDAIIDDGSVVMGNAKVFDGAIVRGDSWGGSEVKDNAVICDKARLVSGTASGHARICGNALTYHGTITDYACIKDHACVNGHGFLMCDYATVSGNAEVTECIVTGRCQIRGDAKVVRAYIGDRAIIKDNAEVYGCAGYVNDYYDVIIKDSALIEGNAGVYGNADNGTEMKGGVIIGGTAHVGVDEDVVDTVLGIEATPDVWDMCKTLPRQAAITHMTQKEIEELNKLENTPIPELIEETYEEDAGKENDGADYGE